MDRDESPAFKVCCPRHQAPPCRDRGEFGNGDCPGVRWYDFRSDGFSTVPVQLGLRLLAYLGFVTVELDGPTQRLPAIIYLAASRHSGVRAPDCASA